MASSSLFAAGRRLGRGRGRLFHGRSRAHNPTPPLLPLRTASSPRSYSSERAQRRPPSLQSTLWPLGHPGTLLVPEIERWAEKSGNRLRPVELERVVKELRKRRRHRQALEVIPSPCPPSYSMKCGSNFSMLCVPVYLLQLNT